MSNAEARGARQAAAEFLRAARRDRYDPDAIDWRDVPPWRQTSFFGIRARGQFFVYVVDCSGSMIDEDRLVRAKDELRRSVLSLQQPQRFKVIFYNDQPVPMPGDLPRSADLTSKNQLLAWLRLIEPDGETDPRGAMALALAHAARRRLPPLRRRVPRRDGRGDRPARTRARSRSTAST